MKTSDIKTWQLYRFILIFFMMSALEVVAETQTRRCVGSECTSQNPGDKDTKIKFLETPPPRSEERTDRLSNACQYWLEDFVPTWRHLLRNKPKDIKPHRNLSLLSAIKQQDCLSASKRDPALRVLQNALSTSSKGTVVTLIPLSGALGKIGNSIKDGITYAHQEISNTRNTITFVDTKADARTTFLEMTKQLLTSDVRMLIGGVTIAESKVLLKWSKKLRIPTLILNGSAELDFAHPYAFRLFPTQSSLAKSLVKAIRSEGFEKIAFFRPNGSTSEVLSKILRKQLSPYQIEVSRDVTYSENQFESMKYATKQLFQLRPEDRPEEYRDFMAEILKKSENDQQSIDAEAVHLPPKKDFDAIFFPDDFRIVKHAMKLFKFYGVDKVKLLGNQEWRSKSLVKPFDDIFINSLFVDYIGLYLDLPAGLRNNVSNEKFVDPVTARHIDYGMVGYTAAMVAIDTAPSKTTRRSTIAKHVKNMKYPDRLRSFQTGQMFDSNHEIHWPSFIFRVQNADISLLR